MSTKFADRLVNHNTLAGTTTITAVRGKKTGPGKKQKNRPNKGTYRSFIDFQNTASVAFECHRRNGRTTSSMVTLWQPSDNQIGLKRQMVRSHKLLREMVAASKSFCIGKVEVIQCGFVHMHLIVSDPNEIEKYVKKKRLEAKHWGCEPSLPQEISVGTAAEASRYILKTLFIQGKDGLPREVTCSKTGKVFPRTELDAAILASDKKLKSVVVTNARTYTWGSRKGKCGPQKIATEHAKVKAEMMQRTIVDGQSDLHLIVANQVERIAQMHRLNVDRVEVRRNQNGWAVKPAADRSDTPSIKYFLVDALRRSPTCTVLSRIFDVFSPSNRNHITTAINNGWSGMELKLQDITKLAGTTVVEFLSRGKNHRWWEWVRHNRAINNLPNTPNPCFILSALWTEAACG